MKVVYKLIFQIANAKLVIQNGKSLKVNLLEVKQKLRLSIWMKIANSFELPTQDMETDKNLK